ncbi:MAG TPA: LPS assembly lipoprotein LptE [Xanthobacteraceae bacterium]|nr:LPS assembly lipoprotein LptE [Xanthobacteraceae bacterium]
MSSVERKSGNSRGLLLTAALLAATLAGCQFQPMYAETPLQGSGPSLNQALRDVDVAFIGGRIGNELRNDLIYELTGGQGNREGAPYRLTLVANVSAFSPVIDPQSGRSAAQMIAFDITYKLHDVVQDRIVLTETAIARVSIDTAGQLFANMRAKRDAENRAAKVAADQIRARLASYFLTRT